MKPKYSTLVKALEDFNHAVLCGVFNSMERKEIDDSPWHLRIEQISNRVERLIKRAKTK